MLFRVEPIPHRDRKEFGKCRACKRHSTFKIRLHKLTATLRATGKYEWEEVEVPIRYKTGKKKGQKTGKTEKVMKKTPVIVKEFRPIGNKPYLLCSRKCIVLAQLAFL
jgi:hypothetical protein